MSRFCSRFAENTSYVSFPTLLLSAGLLALGVLGTSSLAEARGGGRAGGAVPGQPRAPDVGGGEFLRERRQRLRDQPRTPAGAQRAPTTTTAPAAAPGVSLVHLHHGSVEMGADLARVQLTLEVENTGGTVMEWQQTYALDPHAEVIGALLKRDGEDAIRARTLTSADAGRIYSQIRTPPTPRTPNRDPLLVARPQDDQLAIRIWPIEAQETIRVELTFVTPLRGHGVRRTYRDVMGGPMRKPTRVPDAQRPAPTTTIAAKASWLISPGSLVLATNSTDGMEFTGARADRLHFKGVAATTPSTPAPQVGFLSRERAPEAQLVGNGSFSGRIATWRFDPATFLAERGYAHTRGLQLKLEPRRGSCNRLVPNLFAATGEARPIAARVSKRDAEQLQYSVVLLDRDGNKIERFAQTVPLRRNRLTKSMEGAVAAWHRSGLVRRVYAWAGKDQARLLEAQKYSVDVGVLSRGTSALAVPRSERRRMSAANRRLYDADGVPLGAQKGEANFRAPPHRSLGD